MDKKRKKNLTLRFVVIGLLPVLLLTIYFAYFGLPEPPAGKPNTPNVLKSEKDSAISMTARNSWYLTMLLRKVELTGRMSSDVIEGVFKRQNAFFTLDDYKRIKPETSGKFYWNPEKETANLFVCGAYKTVSKEGRIPVIGAYLDSTLLLGKRNLMSKENPNGAVVSSVYVMTDTALRKFPWVSAADNLIKAGMFTVGNYKVRPDSLFVNEENSPYTIAGPKSNKTRLEIWSEPYWSRENGCWMVSYFMPLYLDEAYKGVLGMDLSVQKLLEMLIGKDQVKKFGYDDTFPVLISKSGLLVASSIYGYDQLKVSADNPLQAELKKYGTEKFKSSLARVIDPRFWDNTAADDALGGIESLQLGKNEYYFVHFPLRTGGFTFGLFIPAANLEKSAAVSTTTIKAQKGSINFFALKAGIVAMALSVLLMVILAGFTSRNEKRALASTKDNMLEESVERPALTPQEQEVFAAKIAELNSRNEELSVLLEKSTEELKLAQSRSRPAPEVGFSKYIHAKEINDQFDSERKTLNLRIKELEIEKEETERRMQDKTEENHKLIIQSQASRQVPAVDLSKYISLEEYKSRLEADGQSFIEKLKEFEKSRAELEAGLKEAQLEKIKLNERVKELSVTGSAGQLEEQQRLAQRLGEVQRSNDGFKNSFEQLKKQNGELEQKIELLENEGRNLANTLVNKFEEEKKGQSRKIEELNKQVNVGAARIVELENKIKTDSVKLVELDPSKFIPVQEVNTRLEIEKKNYVLKIQELENKIKAAEVKAGDPAEFIPAAKMKKIISGHEDSVNQLESAIKTLNKEKAELAKQLAEVAASGQQKVLNTVSDATKRLETDRKVKELEMAKQELEHKYVLLMNENRQVKEALTLVEGRKKETDKQAQSLMQKVGESQQQTKEKIKELELDAGRLKAERDAAMKQYEVLSKELEEVKAEKTQALNELNAAKVLQENTDNSEAGAKAEQAQDANTVQKEMEQENNLLVVDDQGEIIKIFGDSLYNMGYSVYIARNVKLAKQKLSLGNYRNVVLNVNLADGDYKEFFESIKKGDPKFAERIIFFNNDEKKDQEVLAGKKIMKSTILEKDIKSLMS